MPACVMVPWGPWVGVGSVHLSQLLSLRKAQFRGVSPGYPPRCAENRSWGPSPHPKACVEAAQGPAWGSVLLSHHCEHRDKPEGWLGSGHGSGHRLQTPFVCDRGKVIGPLCLSFLFSKGRKAGVKGGCTQHCGHQPVTQAAVTAPWMGC